MSITVEGALRRDAESLVVGDGLRAGIRLSIDAGKGYPFEVTRIVGGNEPAAHINAKRLADSMRRGAACNVTADSLILRTDFGDATFVMRGVAAVSVDGRPLP